MENQQNLECCCQKEGIDLNFVIQQYPIASIMLHLFDHEELKKLRLVSKKLNKWVEAKYMSTIYCRCVGKVGCNTMNGVHKHDTNDAYIKIYLDSQCKIGVDYLSKCPQLRLWLIREADWITQLIIGASSSSSSFKKTAFVVEQNSLEILLRNWLHGLKEIRMTNVTLKKMLDDKFRIVSNRDYKYIHCYENGAIKLDTLYINTVCQMDSLQMLGLTLKCSLSVKNINCTYSCKLTSPKDVECSKSKMKLINMKYQTCKFNGFELK